MAAQHWLQLLPLSVGPIAWLEPGNCPLRSGNCPGGPGNRGRRRQRKVCGVRRPVPPRHLNVLTLSAPLLGATHENTCMDFIWRASHTMSVCERGHHSHPTLCISPCISPCHHDQTNPRRRVGTARAVSLEARVMIHQYFREIIVHHVMSVSEERGTLNPRNPWSVRVGKHV